MFTLDQPQEVLLKFDSRNKMQYRYCNNHLPSHLYRSPEQLRFFWFAKVPSYWSRPPQPLVLWNDFDHFQQIVPSRPTDITFWNRNRHLKSHTDIECISATIDGADSYRAYYHWNVQIRMSADIQKVTYRPITS